LAVQLVPDDCSVVLFDVGGGHDFSGLTSDSLVTITLFATAKLHRATGNETSATDVFGSRLTDILAVDVDPPAVNKSHYDMSSVRCEYFPCLIEKLMNLLRRIEESIDIVCQSIRDTQLSGRQLLSHLPDHQPDARAANFMTNSDILGKLETN
jgi:hypothetical protein